MTDTNKALRLIEAARGWSGCKNYRRPRTTRNEDTMTDTTTTPGDMRGVSAFARGYLVCALWASVNLDTGDPLDRDHALTDFEPDAWQRMIREADEFAEENASALSAFEDATGRDDEHMGHDLWLSRNGHGTGFWDRGGGLNGDDLHQSAQLIGERTLYVTNQGKIDILEGV